jgi:hypothetical protein
LIRRKILKYGHIHRHIKDFDITIKKGNMYLNVFSILIPPSARSSKSFISKILGQRKKSSLLNS